MSMKPELTNSIDQACARLRAGEVVALPTETVYGLGADATNDQAVAKIYALKNRPQFNPLIVHVADLDHAAQDVEVDEAAQALAARFWPGPLTLVLPLKTSSKISLLCSAGLETLAVRAPNHPTAQALLRALGKPLAAPSANPSTQLSPTCAEHVMTGFPQQDLMVLDGGPCGVGVESTIIQVSRDGQGQILSPCILRYGSITKEQIEEVLGCACRDHTHPETIRAPGQMLRHYAPSKPIRLAAHQPKAGEGYLGFGKHAHGPLNLSPTADLQEAAANLFKMLHHLDHSPCAAIAVAPIPETGIGVAINDRLKRSAE